MESDEKVLSKLKFIGKLKKGDKVNVRYLFIQPEGFITGISRTIVYPDNRSNTLNFVRTTIDNSFSILYNYIESKEQSDMFRVNNIIDDLKQSKQGMVNLKETYISDSKFCCDMDIILQDIDAKLIHIRNLLGKKIDSEKKRKI